MFTFSDFQNDAIITEDRVTIVKHYCWYSGSLTLICDRQWRETTRESSPDRQSTIKNLNRLQNQQPEWRNQWKTEVQTRRSHCWGQTDDLWWTQKASPSLVKWNAVAEIHRKFIQCLSYTDTGTFIISIWLSPKKSVDNLISRKNSFEWPPHSPNLNPCYFFL